MIYPDSFESKTGFTSVRERLVELCMSPLGVAEVGAMAFAPDYESVSRRLAETHEMTAIKAAETEFPLESIHDISPQLASLRIEGTYISAPDLARLRATLATMAAVATYFRRQRDDEGRSPYPTLDSLAEGLQAFPQRVADIDRIIDARAEIKDNASPALADIRRAISATSGTVSSLMRRVLTRALKEGYVEPDTTPSVRDGRLVIPVSPMYKRKIAGIVHDESASGKTVYIEPTEVVEVNNRLRELELDERREEIRILRALSDRLRPDAEAMAASLTVLGRFDFIMAKAAYAVESRAAMPRLAKKPALDWRDARHPVLAESLARQSKKIVPLDITLTPTERILVISGPNAGGKSVTLKTAGIIQYMLQCGLLPPVADNSTAGVFGSIFIDIGDDQSIEDDLSTYSSHLRNMKTFLARSDRRSLVLIDEFGAGTEPQIGGAIAQAILGRLNESGVWGVITTHFRNLKQFAEEHNGLVNGSMLYDRHLMQPMFKLSIGHPGSSFAIEIARKTGLPDSIIADAEQIIGSDYVNFDKYLLDINRDKRYWENKRQSIKQKEKQLDELLEKYDSEQRDLRQQRRQIIDDARREAGQIIADSNAAVERTILDIRRSQADKEKTLEARRRLAAERERIESDDRHDEADRRLTKKMPRPKKKAPKTETAPARPELRPISIGDNVLLDGQDTVGTVTAISGKNATVIFGNLTTTTRLDRLRHTDRKVDSGARKAASFVSVATREDMRDRQLKFKPEIDIRGMRVDEALQAVTYFIDDAVQFNSQRVRILHGTGTGALRQSVRDYLNSVKAVRVYHDEDVRLGGAGITVVEF